MTLFESQRTQACIAFVKAGGQALEEWDASYTRGPNVPRCFSNKDFAKLYDDDELRLVTTAKRLGVRVIKIDRRGQSAAQHVDLVGAPMRKAIQEAEKYAGSYGDEE